MLEGEYYYRPREIYELYGYPLNRLMVLARKINRRSNPDAERGWHYLLTMREVKKFFGY